jgi:hypothetical protein
MWNVLGEQEDLRRECELHLQPRDSLSADRGWYKHPSAGDGGVVDIAEEIQKSYLKVGCGERAAFCL